MNNTILGNCFSIYGTVALFSYLFGGPIADKFAPRKLMAFALASTALGGFLLATYPSHATIQGIYAYWGFTTIFLFWAAMLKATRQWGGEQKQGRAFGFLDGGRGLVSALLGTVGVAIFSTTMTATENPVLEDQRQAFWWVIVFTSCLVLLVSVLVWFFLDTPSSRSHHDAKRDKSLTFSDLLKALQLRSVWLLMLIVLCGYVGYKVTDDLSLYANEVMLFNEVNAARLGTLLLFVRPIVGVAAGFLADWTRAASWIVAGFATMLCGAILIGSGIIEPGSYTVFAVSILATCLGVYSIRSLYFAAMQEGQIPLAVTGTAIGLISVVGYTPDIFMGPVMGKLLDGSPGEPGHQHLFWLLAGFSVVGLIAAVVFRQSVIQKSKSQN